MRQNRRHVILIATLLGAIALAGAPTQPHAQTGSAAADKKTADRDREAKRLFVSGNYREAITVLTELYSDTGNPVYLRNIARCHQRLRDPDRAIASFEEYLLRGKDITAAEREEVKGFIRDLEELKRREGGAARPAAPAASAPAPAGPAAVPPSPSPVPLPGAAPTASPLAAAPMPQPGVPLEQPAISSSAGDAPGNKQWQRTAGMAALIGAGALAVGGGAMLTASWLNYKTGRDDGCGTTKDCPERQGKIKTRNKLAAGLLIGAAVAGAAGGTLLLIAPAPDSSGAMTGLTVATRGSF